MVVVAIIGIISAVVVTNQSSFSNTITLSNTAYDVALTLRSAQTYGIGGRAAFGAAANAGYGLHFNRARPESFILFADIYPRPSISSCHPTSNPSAPDAKPGNCSYDQDKREKVVGYTIGNGMVVSKLCAYSGSWSCELSSIDIVFLRPNPNPFISTNGSYSSSVSSACLTIRSPQGGERYISVAASGQINANATSCPL